MNTARYSAGLATVDDKVYVIGGADSKSVPLSVVEEGLYDQGPPVSGEVFKIQTNGTQYCGDFNIKNLSANNGKLWVRVDSKTGVTISSTESFVSETIFSMTGLTYSLSKNKSAITVNGSYENGLYVTLQVTIEYNKSGSIKIVTGTFMQNGIISRGCFSSTKFKAVAVGEK